MNAQEIKDGMSKGTWELSDLHVLCAGKPIGQVFLGSMKHDRGGRMIPDNVGTANALAITTAVNNTYNQGIDPAAVPDMVKMLESLTGLLRMHDCRIAANEITALLTTAKLK